MEHNKASSLQLFLLLFLGISLFISIIAVPFSRSLETITRNPTFQESHDKVVKEAEEKRVLLVERDDYEGTGANNRHDPTPPGID